MATVNTGKVAGKKTLQNTLAGRVEFKGVGVHSGKPVSMTVSPADPGHGITFVRSDLPVDQQRDIQADIYSVAATDLCTVLGDPSSNHVKTVEHLMAALIAMGIDNAQIEVDRAEIPVMDGSSEVFVDAFENVGIIAQARARRYLRVLREVRVDMGASYAVFTPGDATLYDIEIDFETPLIGRQSWSGELTPQTFKTELSRARTFGFMRDVEKYWAAGFALGSSLENSVVIADDHTVINPEGLRYEQEFVRHKALDAVGDLALAGAPFLGTYKSYRGGHRLNALALEKLLSDEANYEWTYGETVSREAGRPAGRVELVAVSAAAYSADKS
ncbi:MAG: UDP-3-O-acyl-N-acetylglucosamine deacetylase [Pseudomonadota bacterium]